MHMCTGTYMQLGKQWKDLSISLSLLSFGLHVYLSIQMSAVWKSLLELKAKYTKIHNL